MTVLLDTRCRVLVTGAAGFIGSHLVDALLIRGFQVVGLDRRHPDRDPTAAANLADARRYRQFAFVHADLTCDELGEWVAGCDTVYHFAAPPDSCASIYATPGPNGEPDPLTPATAHGQSKQVAEQLCLCRGIPADATMSVVALRYGDVYGPRQQPEALIPRIMRAVRTRTPIDLSGEAGRRQPLYVSDAVRAALAAAAVDVREAVVNATGRHTVALDELVDLVQAVTGLTVPVSGGYPQPDPAGLTVDLYNAYFVLGYRPRISLPDGLRRYWLATADPAPRSDRPRRSPPSPAPRNVSRSRSNAPRWGSR